MQLCGYGKAFFNNEKCFCLVQSYSKCLHLRVHYAVVFQHYGCSAELNSVTALFKIFNLQLELTESGAVPAELTLVLLRNFASTFGHYPLQAFVGLPYAAVSQRVICKNRVCMSFIFVVLVDRILELLQGMEKLWIGQVTFPGSYDL